MTSTHNTRSSALKSPQLVKQAQNTRHVSQKNVTGSQKSLVQNKPSKKDLEKLRKPVKVEEKSEDGIIKSTKFCGKNSQRQNESLEIEQEIDSAFDRSSPRKSLRSQKCDPKSDMSIFEGLSISTPRSTLKGKRSSIEIGYEVESNLNLKRKASLKNADTKRNEIDTPTSDKAGIKRKIESYNKDILLSENEDERKQVKRSRRSTSQAEVIKDGNTGYREKNSNENENNINQAKHLIMQKKNTNEEKSFANTSPPRRSSRTVVPNRKFKDMEVDYTPNKRNTKSTVDSEKNVKEKTIKTIKKKDINGNKSSCTSAGNEIQSNNEDIEMEENISDKNERGKPIYIDNDDGRDKPVQESINKGLSESIYKTGKSIEIEKMADTACSQDTDKELDNGDEIDDGDDNGSIDNTKRSPVTENAEVESFTLDKDEEEGYSPGLIDPVTGLIDGLKVGEDRILNESSELVESSTKIEETGGKDGAMSESNKDAENNVNKNVETPFKDNVLGTLTVSEAPEDGNTIITSDDLHIEDVPVVEVTLSTETANCSSEIDIIQSIGEIVETIESKSYPTECRRDSSVSGKNKGLGVMNERKSESESHIIIPGDIGKEVEKLIEISKNLERGQTSLSGKESKNMFIKEVPVSTISTTMPGRIQTATIIKNPNAVQTVKEIPIQSSECKNKIILVAGRNDVIEGVSNTEKGNEDGIIHVTNPNILPKMASILNKRKISDRVSQKDSNEELNQSSESMYIVEDKQVIQDVDSKSGMSSASTQTPLMSSKSNTGDNKQLTNPVFKTITVNVQQPSAVEDDEEVVEDQADKNSQKQSKFVIVHLPEGSTVKRYTVKEEKTEDVPFTEGEDGSFICGICQYTTPKRANWYKHKKKHTTDPPSRPHKCPKCNYRAATSSNLKRHIAIHDDIREFHCQICSMTFRQKIHLERHVKYRHEEKSVMCPLCDYVCANENPDLKIHIKRKHLPHDANDGTIQAYSCDQCGIVTISRKDLKQHMKFHRKGPELKLFCGQCSFVTDCESRLKRHILIHTKERPFQCGLCDYRGSQKEHVLRHMRSQHQIEIHRRQKKLEPLDDDSDSNIEMEKKTDQSDYSSHEKIFACNHCSMKFAKLINLYKHLHAQHKDILPDPKDDEHLCVVCDFRTTTKKNLLVHMRKHNLQDQNPPSHVYSCVLCKYINPKRRNLFQHMKKKHGIEIVMKDDGSTSCFVTDNTPVVIGRDESVSNILTVGDVVTATTEETPLQIVTDEVSSSKDSVPLQNVITIEDLAYAVSHPQPVNQGEETSQIEAVTEHEAAEAIEGLQALAEQPGIIEGQEIIAYDTQQLIIDEAEQQGEKIQMDGMVETEVVTMETDAPSVEIEEDKNGEEMGGIQLSQEQLASLSTGDYVEINGEMYKVEISTEENGASIQEK